MCFCNGNNMKPLNMAIKGRITPVKCMSLSKLNLLWQINNDVSWILPILWILWCLKYVIQLSSTFNIKTYIMFKQKVLFPFAKALWQKIGAGYWFISLLTIEDWDMERLREWEWFQIVCCLGWWLHVACGCCAADLWGCWGCECCCLTCDVKD